MKNRRYHTQMNLLLEPDMYARIRMILTLEKISMSNIIRDSIELSLARYDKENNSITIENPTQKEE